MQVDLKPFDLCQINVGCGEELMLKKCTDVEGIPEEELCELEMDFTFVGIKEGRV